MTGLPGGTPREALCLAAREIAGEGFDPELDAAFAGRDDALTLRALVEVAGRLGLAAEAFEAGWDDLASRPGPAVLHLSVAGATSFAVAAGVDGERATLLDDDGTWRRVERGRLEPAWTGVVVFLADEGGAAARRARAGRRVRRVAGDPRSLAAAAAAAAIAAAALVSAWRLGAGSAGATALALTAVVLAAAGAGVSAVLFAASRRGHAAAPRLARAVCGQGRFTDCGAVLSSRWSSVFGIDFASYGLAFFASTLLVLASGALTSGRGVEAAWASAAAACLLASPVSVALSVIQVWPLRRICPLCMAVHAVVLGGAAAGASWLAAGGGLPGTPSLAAAGSVHAVAFLAALGLVVPHLETRMERDALAERIGRVFRTPLGAIAELSGGRPVLDTPGGRPVLGDAAGEIRLDAFVHPLCEHCPAFLAELEALLSSRAGTLRAALHFPARDAASAADRALTTALAAIGLAAGGAAALAAFREVEQDPWRWLAAAGDQGESVASRLAPGAAPGAETFSRAREAVRDDTAFVRRLDLGTPALFVEGRAWDAPVARLGDALDEHEALLREAAGLPARGRGSPIA